MACGYEVNIAGSLVPVRESGNEAKLREQKGGAGPIINYGPITVVMGVTPSS